MPVSVGNTATKSMTEKNGGTASQVCNGLLSVGGWVIKSSRTKGAFIFTASFFVRSL
jgi:hypothetical protein